jgi:hypothetical protein
MLTLKTEQFWLPIPHEIINMFYSSGKYNVMDEMHGKE